ncbi:hypothetical protein EVC13_024 [Rhizobium phage RHph_I65]|nr:hypothetical protein EVC13_024 [Rhizobium phage RHph_I65]
MEMKVAWIVLAISIAVLVWAIFADHSMSKCLETHSQETCVNTLR